MVTSRDSQFMRKSTLLTKHVHFYDLKFQIKPKTEVSRITIIPQKIQPRKPSACQVKPSPSVSFQTKLLDLQFKVLENYKASIVRDLPVNAKEVLVIL